MFRLATRWFMWRMEMLALVTVLITGGVCVASKGSVSPATAGLALSSVFISATFIAILMNIKAMFKAFINSLERNLEFIQLPQEAPAVVPGNRRRTEGWNCGPDWSRKVLSDLCPAPTGGAGQRPHHH